MKQNDNYYVLWLKVSSFLQNPLETSGGRSGMAAGGSDDTEAEYTESIRLVSLL